MSDELEKSREAKRAELAATIAEYEAQAANYIQAAKELKTELVKLDLLAGYGNTPAGNLTIQWKRPNRKFDEKAFRAAHPFNKEPEYYSIVVNSKALPENIKDSYMVPGEGEGTVTIK